MIRVTQEKLEAVFTLEVAFFGKKYDSFKDAMDGARVGAMTSYAPMTKALPICKRLKASGFKLVLSPEIVASFEALLLHEEKDKEHAGIRLEEVKRGLAEMGMELYPFQEVGVYFLASRRGALLSDQQGTGKSIQALTALPYRVPVLVVCPAVAKGVWKREAAKWRPDFRVTILTGTSSFRWPQPGEIVITNYDLLPETPPLNAPLNLSGIFDEAQYLKSFKSRRRKASAKLAEIIVNADGRVWLLTGTPLQNEPPELYSVLEIAGLANEAFGRYADFVKLFHGKTIKLGKLGVQKTVWGAPDETVPERLSRVMLRRMREDVLKDLPPKRISVLEVDVSEDYMRELDKIAYALSSEDGVSLQDPYTIYAATKESRVVFDKVATLRKLVAQSKIPAALALAEQYEEENEPILIMSAHLEPLRAFSKRPGWETIEGKTPAHLRTGLEEAFQRGELKGLACSIRAAGTALTLTRARVVVFVDESWNPADNEQAEDRVCRIGQKRGVEIIRLFADHELDKHVLRVLHRKERLITRVVNAAAKLQREAR